MGKHAGEAVHRPGRRQLVPYLLAVVVTVLAWVVLVSYAIRLGSDARAGQTAAWVLLGFATLGAIGCLFLALTFVVRIVGLVRPVEPPASLPGGRRARR